MQQIVVHNNHKTEKESHETRAGMSIRIVYTKVTFQIERLKLRLAWPMGVFGDSACIIGQLDVHFAKPCFVHVSKPLWEQNKQANKYKN